MKSGAYAKPSTANFYTDALRKLDVAKTKRCKPVEEQGCGRRKPLEQFFARTRYLADGTPKLAYEGWCMECSRRRSREKTAKLYQKKKLPSIRYSWDKSKQRYRVLMHSETVATVVTEDEAREMVVELKARDKIYKMFFRLAAPELVWCPDSQDMVAR